MRGKHSRMLLNEPVLRRKPLTIVGEELQKLTAQHQGADIVSLQRLVGNRGLQSLLAQGRVSQIGASTSIARAIAPTIQRCGCGGSCAACKQEEELNISAGAANEAQRWWDDEETESDGGSWLDDAADWVSDKASDAYDWATDSGGGSESESGGTETEEGGGGSWWDEATDEVNSWFEGDETENEEDADGGGSSWWDEATDEVNSWFEGDEEESEEPTEEEESWLDWIPDIEFPFFNDEEQEEEPVDLEELDEDELQVEVDGDEVGQGVCASGHGSGSSGGVSVAGKTNVDWGATTGAASFLNPSINKRKVGAKTVYDVSGTVHIDYSGADAQVSFKVTPPLNKLNACKQEKVNAFKSPSGALGQHEAKHVAAMNGFNGSEEFAHTFTGLEASTTEELTEKVNKELDKVVQPKIKARQDAAQSASDNLDPWSEPIPGIASCPP